MIRKKESYPENFKRKVVAQIERGEIGLESARRKYGIGGKMTISKWIKKFGNCAAEIPRARSAMRKKKPDDSPEGRLAAAEREIALYKCLIEVSDYFRDPAVKKKIAERLLAMYGPNSAELEQLDIPWLKYALYSASADKPTISTGEDK